MNEQKKLRKLAIKKLMADGCPEDLARLMPKGSADYSNVSETFLTDWFEWIDTEQGDIFWDEINHRNYSQARKTLIELGLKPWSKKVKAAKAKTEFEVMNDEQKKSTIDWAFNGNKSCQITLINHLGCYPSAISKEWKNG